MLLKSLLQVLQQQYKNNVVWIFYMCILLKKVSRRWHKVTGLEIFTLQDYFNFS